MCIPVESMHMENGIIHIEPEAIAVNPPEDARPNIQSLIGCIVTTLDNHELGTITDLMIAYRTTGWLIESIKVRSSDFFKDKLSQLEFSIPSERISLKETSDKWHIVAHVKVASEVALNR